MQNVHGGTGARQSMPPRAWVHALASPSARPCDMRAACVCSGGSAAYWGTLLALVHVGVPACSALTVCQRQVLRPPCPPTRGHTRWVQHRARRGTRPPRKGGTPLSARARHLPRQCGDCGVTAAGTQRTPPHSGITALTRRAGSSSSVASTGRPRSRSRSVSVEAWVFSERTRRISV